jgi:hypothetical protein
VRLPFRYMPAVITLLVIAIATGMVDAQARAAGPRSGRSICISSRRRRSARLSRGSFEPKYLGPMALPVAVTRR